MDLEKKSQLVGGIFLAKLNLNLFSSVFRLLFWFCFLLQVASDPNETTAGILASMMPCMRLYAYIGCTLAEAFPAAENHPFYSWLTTYQDQQFLHAVATAERLLDSLAPEIVPPEGERNEQ